MQAELKEARAVFLGEPIAMTSLTVRFRVEAVWKGDLGPNVVMATGARANPDGTVAVSSCDASFSLGGPYLVVAFGASNETMTAGKCGFTGPSGPTSPLTLLDSIVPRRAPSQDVVPRPLIAVLGLVREPGVFEWTPGTTVAGLVARAGGPTRPEPSPNSHLVGESWLMRQNGRTRTRTVTRSTAIQPDDELFVGRDLLEDVFDFSLLGAGTSDGVRGCATFARGDLPAGSEVTLILPDKPQRTVSAILGPEMPRCDMLAERIGIGTVYQIEPRGDVEKGRPFIVIAGRPEVRQSGAEISVRLDGSSPAARVRSCTSSEGVHLTVWSGPPLVSRRLWHAYWYLGMDVVPTCVEGDYK